MTRKAVVSLTLLVIASLGFSTCFGAEPETRACATDASALSKFSGEYVSNRFLRVLTQTRSLTEAAKANTGEVSAVGIRPGSIVLIYAWHEGGEGQCVHVSREKLRIPSNDQEFTRIGARDSSNDPGDYFDRIFAGCFAADDQSKWCFRTNAVEVDGKTHRAELKLDLSETWGENPVHIDGDRSRFWLFRPVANGWQVYQAGWASDGSPEPDWEKPWRVLRRAS